MFDALVFEFMGLAMLALCVIVLAVPSQRRPLAPAFATTDGSASDGCLDRNQAADRRARRP